MIPIPIQNIYYLLCYAWDKLEESESVAVNAMDTTKLIDLFATVLSHGTSRLLKQGLDRYYIDDEHAVQGIKGKLDLSATIKRNSLLHQQTVCRYDEFDFNILHNQIIKTTISSLLKSKIVDSSINEELHTLYKKMPPIAEIRLRNAHFQNIRLHKNNQYYDFVLKVCQIIHDNLLIDERSGTYKFKDFLREEKAMARLFEEFVRNFYKIESEYSVGRESISWQFAAEDEEDLGMLPVMNTDITLQSSSRKIIIDTKYYKEAFVTQYVNPKIHSENLYQLFAYLNNQNVGSEKTRCCEGILLYPSVDGDFEYNFKYRDHRIRVASINLNDDWNGIKKNLLTMINN